ncbi:tRNA pseudouridine(55) synthase TruB [Herbiconiux daphne]|uniref:tRNA pseudouridine synthase B n=1 Tax=Herbiconiux daphne TaxID=2970914 RepID=A0ABT2H207_9MICO|nr:tRNA pseudouridine(55) synthase TruB [Herbiconiux daphne]MCS5733960.1 tRNA pseudouridine(55) synthase TruB [Herbiconiux daphne]
MPNSSPRREQSTISGILLVDKSGGLTSHDVVARTRRLAGTRKVGHAGTLDPLATGLLLLGLNSSTRLLTYLVGLDKEYLATVRLGAATTTDDSEGEITTTAAPDAVEALDPADIERAFDTQRGTITQVPSSVSAIKVDGQRAYARVRSGEEVVLAGRTVTISEIALLAEPRSATDDEGRPFVDVDVRVVCSSGTYIRAIARDVGAALGVGGHLTSLRRTRVGPFAVTDAHTLEQLGDLAPSTLPLLEPADVARRLFPVLDVATAEAIALGHGQRIAVDAERVGAPASGAGPASGPVAAITPEGRLLGLVEIVAGSAKSIVNFPPDEYATVAGGAIS